MKEELKAEYNNFVKTLKKHCYREQHKDMAQIQFNYYMVHFPFETWLKLKESGDFDIGI